MNRAILMSLLLLATSLAGCTELGGEECEYDVDGNTMYGTLIEDGSCFPMTGGEFGRMISETSHFDGYSLASQYSFFSLDVDEITSVDGTEVINSWRLWKNDTIGLSYVGHSLEIDGVKVVEYEIYHGLTDVYFSDSDGDLQRGRDMHPDYEDPFVEIFRLSQQDPNGVWPAFYYDFSPLEGQSWVVTGDASELFQVGRTISDGTNGEAREVYVATQGFPPVIQAIEVFSDSLSERLYFIGASIEDDAMEYFYLLQDGTLEEVWYSGGYIPNPTIDRAPIPFILVPEVMLIEGGSTGVTGIVPEAMKHEVNLSEIEMHVFVENSSVASLILDDGSTNITLDDGTWWELRWEDAGLVGLLSYMDSYTVTTNSSETYDIRIFDHWAQAWTDHVD